MQIELFDGTADPERLLSCYRIVQECWPVDQPDLPQWSLESFAGKWAHGFTSDPQQSWLGTDESGEPVGCYLLTLPELDNTSVGNCVLQVAPRYRRARAGTALLEHCAEQARKAGRTRLRGHAFDDSAGSAFARRAGATAGITDLTRQLHIDDALAGRLAALRREAEPFTAGYSLLSWRGETPAEYLDQVVGVHAAMADMPRDQDMEPMVWDADRIRRIERIAGDAGVVFYSVAARQDQTGEFAALTQTLTDPGAPGWAIQQMTGVTRSHRGHRLGLLVKIGMLELLASLAPEVRDIVTGNAGSNQHMIAINEQLGFVISHVSRAFELDLTQAG